MFGCTQINYVLEEQALFFPFSFVLSILIRHCIPQTFLKIWVNSNPIWLFCKYFEFYSKSNTIFFVSLKVIKNNSLSKIQKLSKISCKTD